MVNGCVLGKVTCGISLCCFLENNRIVERYLFFLLFFYFFFNWFYWGVFDSQNHKVSSVQPNKTPSARSTVRPPAASL